MKRKRNRTSSKKTEIATDSDAIKAAKSFMARYWDALRELAK